MPKREKQRFYANFMELAENILELVGQTDDQGRQTTLDIFQTSAQQYKEKFESYFHPIYKWTSLRRPEIKSTILEIKDAIKATTFKHRFVNFISNGGTTQTSANFYLLKNLIVRLDVYQKETDDAYERELPKVIECIQKAFEQEAEKIKEEEQLTQAALTAKTKERQRCENRMNKIIIVKDTHAPIDQRDGNVFLASNIKKTNHWNIKWLDCFGHKHKVALPKKATFYSIESLKLNSKSHNALRIRLANWLDKAIHAIKIQVVFTDGLRFNPNHFVLNTQARTLSWVNAIGATIPINLSSYPPLEAFLNKEHNWTSNDLETRLKTLLLGVNTRQAKNSLEQKVMLDKQIFKQNAASTLTYPCKMIQKFNSDIIQANYRNTILLTPDNNLWKIYYINNELKHQLISHRDLPKNALQVLQQWPINAKSVDDPQRLLAFGTAMNDFIPPVRKVKKLNGDYSKLAELIDKRARGPQPETRKTKKAGTTHIQSIAQAMKPSPQNQSITESLQRFFQNKATLSAPPKASKLESGEMSSVKIAR